MERKKQRCARFRINELCTSTCVSNHLLARQESLHKQRGACISESIATIYVQSLKQKQAALVKEAVMNGKCVHFFSIYLWML